LNAVELENVSYAYPEASRLALDQIDLRIAAAESVLIAGASGSGKSTLLRAVNGLVPHFYGGRFAGRASVMGLDTRTTAPQLLAAHVGMVFQDLPARFLSDSVDGEIAFSLELAGNGGRLTAGQVEAISERMGVAHLRGRRLEHLSAGEQARLAIAAALARRPKVLLLDEPVTHIDPAGSQAVVGWASQLRRQEGVTVLLAEHRPEVWRAMIDREIRLGADGRIVSDVDPRPGEAPALDATLDEVPSGMLGAIPSGMLGAIPSGTLSAVAPSTLRARGLDIILGRRPILRGIDMDLTPGELVAVVGRNGSGKTTLLRALVGLQRVESGHIELGGRPISSWAPTERIGRLGFVPQAPASMLFAETAEDEIASTLRRRGEAAGAVEPWLEAFGLAGVRQRYPRDLSAGERQRLALGAILAGLPSVLLLDEPTLGMDRARLAWLGGVLTELRRGGCAILVATHDPGFVAGFATRAVLLAGGGIVAHGDPQDVLRADPAFADALSRWKSGFDMIGSGAEPRGERHADG
jgi:energy-coupling factor transport system ATP-binding protein